MNYLRYTVNNHQDMSEKVQNRIREVLAKKYKTNRWLAKEVHSSENTVSRWANNTGQPTLQKLFEVAKALEVDIRELLEPTL